MIFRPEEVDSTSGVQPDFGPSAQGNIRIPADSGRISIFDYPVPHDNSQGLAAIETGRIYKCVGRRLPHSVANRHHRIV
jgi:hypothetical protein